MDPTIKPSGIVRALQLRPTDTMCDVGLIFVGEDERTVLLLECRAEAHAWQRQEWFEYISPYAITILETDLPPDAALQMLHEKLIASGAGWLCSAALWRWNAENNVAAVAEAGSCKVVRKEPEGWYCLFPESPPAPNGAPRAPIGSSAPQIRKFEAVFHVGAPWALLTGSAFLLLKELNHINDATSGNVSDLLPGASDELLATLNAHGKNTAAAVVVLSAPDTRLFLTK